MRKHGAAFADNAQAAPALPDKHTRKQKECGGGSPAQPGVPSPTTAVRVTRHPAQGLCALRAPGRSSGMWVPPHNGGTHEALSGAGVAASRTCLRHSHCPPFPSPAGGRARHGRDEMGWAVPACKAAALLQWCSPTCATEARQGRTGTCPKGVDPVGQQWWWDQPRAEQDKLQQHRSTLEQAEPSCKGRSNTAPRQHLHLLLPPTAQDRFPHTLTGDRLSLPAAWSLPRSSPAVSGSHKGTASLSSVGGDARGQQGWIRPPSLPPLLGFPNLHLPTCSQQCLHSSWG